MGCLLNPGWFNPFDSTMFYNVLHQHQQLPLPMPMAAPLLTAPVGLSLQEQEILAHLAKAWDGFVNLDNRSDDDNREYRDAIHAAQKMIALRVARRIDAHIWRQPEDNQDGQQA